ncbi:MAG: transporter related protein [Gammaproteobacteria bacterium]|nr:transporter related protein [Gammaproteobacteria bacterium]
MSSLVSLDPHTSLPGATRNAAVPFLQVSGLSKRFGATVALDGVGMAFSPGKIHCVLGENGAGKSTLGKIIGGIHSNDAGTIAIEGQEVTLGTVHRARRFGIAVVFQELSLAPDLSVRANLLLGVEPHAHPFARLRRASERERVLAVLKRLKVNVDAEDRIGPLSVATQQLLEVAKVLIRHPRMIVLDEPTAMLNEAEKQNLYAVLSGLRAEGATIALITHHLEDVEALADHVSIMRDGRVVDSFAVAGRADSKMIAEKLSGVRAVRARDVAKPPAGEAPLLRIEGLRDRAGGAAPLDVRRGEIVGLYGVVGCGAERVVNALAGLRPASDIQVTLDGCFQVLRTPTQARRLGIAYLPTGRASNCILPTRSIRENLNVSLLSHYSRAGFIFRRREAAGTRLQLAASAVKYADDQDEIVRLSGGNQQKVLVARTLRAGSRLLILEDPTAGIDIEAKRQIQEAIRARAAEGVAVILVSSDLPETIELVDTLVTLYAGRVVSRYPSPQPRDKAAIVADVIGQHSAGAG